jgi:glycosyltransferase involved in cell wall biosynthesis
VLHVRTVVVAGGADKTTLKSPYYLRGTGYRAAAAYLRSDANTGFSEIRGRAKQWRCPLFEISDRGAFDITVAPKLYALCRRLKVRIWHAHEYKSNIIGLIVGRLLGLKLVSTIHGWVELTPKLNFFYRLDLIALRRYDRVVVVSQDLHEFCLSKGIRRDRLRLVQNGIETQLYTRRRLPIEARQHFKLARRADRASNRLVIGVLGRLSEEKGLEFLISAFAQVCRVEPDIELWIAGDGNERTALEAQVASSGVGDRVVFLGHVSDAIELFECLDLFCLPSLREGLPNTLLEAMAMEVPVIATKVGGIPAVLHDGIDSRLVVPRSADALATVLGELVSDPIQRDRLARAGRQLVEREFDFQVRMQKLIAVYDELFEAKRARGQ